MAELLNSDFRGIEVYATSAWDASDSVNVSKITEKELGRISGLKSPNKVVAIAKRPDSELAIKELQGGLVLALESINDPGNLGTIMRLADWFGVDHVVCSLDSVDAFHPKVVQASMGACFRVKVHRTELSSVLQDLKGLGKKIYAATMEGSNAFEADLTPDGVLLLGSESHGISETLLQLCDEEIAVPGSGRSESLNVAMAGAVLVAQFMQDQ